MAHALASFASLRVVAPSVGTAPRSNPGNHKRGLVIVAGKKGAWAKEFDPEYEKANAVVVAEVDVNKWPGLDKAKDEDPATYNVLVKKTGRAHVTWNGVGVLQVPKGRDDKESSDVAKTVLLQRIEPLLAEVKRLYPKMNGPFDFVIQKFEDPYAQPVNTTQAVPPGLGLVPAEIVWLKKGKRYPF